jgi:glutamate/tyrosine decarboxylase-like PLP-dependent enzyme
MLVTDMQSDGYGRVADRIAAKERRIAEQAERLAAEYIAAPSILDAAARLLDDARYGRPQAARKSAANSAARLLRPLPRKPVRVPTLAEVLGDDDA